MAPMSQRADTGSFAAPMRGPGSMREANEWVVLEYLRVHAPVSAPQVASDTQLSRPTANLALARLEAAGLVRQTGVRTGRAGRAARLWEPNHDAGRVVGVDVGGQWIRLALADLAGRILDRRRAASRTASATELAQQIAQAVVALLADNSVGQQEVLSIVIGSPGIYDPVSRQVRHASNLPGWEQPAVVDLFSDELGDRVTFENDADLAALGEQAAGLGRDVPDFVYVTVGSGVGMGMIAGGRLQRGAHGAAGEIAFLLVGDAPGDPAGEVRERGMLESATAADAIVAAARAAGLASAASVADVFAAAQDGDPAAVAVVEREADLLARALVMVVAITDPQLVVLGGGVGIHAGFLLQRLRQRLGELVPLPLPRIAVSAVGEDATIIGGLARATSIAWQRAFEVGRGGGARG